MISYKILFSKISVKLTVLCMKSILILVAHKSSFLLFFTFVIYFLTIYYCLNTDPVYIFNLKSIILVHLRFSKKKY